MSGFEPVSIAWEAKVLTTTLPSHTSVSGRELYEMQRLWFKFSNLKLDRAQNNR